MPILREILLPNQTFVKVIFLLYISLRYPFHLLFNIFVLILPILSSTLPAKVALLLRSYLVGQMQVGPFGLHRGSLLETSLGVHVGGRHNKMG